MYIYIGTALQRLNTCFIDVFCNVNGYLSMIVYGSVQVHEYHTKLTYFLRLCNLRNVVMRNELVININILLNQYQFLTLGVNQIYTSVLIGVLHCD